VQPTLNLISRISFDFFQPFNPTTPDNIQRMVEPLLKMTRILKFSNIGQIRDEMSGSVPHSPNRQGHTAIVPSLAPVQSPSLTLWLKRLANPGKDKYLMSYSCIFHNSSGVSGACSNSETALKGLEFWVEYFALPVREHPRET
ncbi:unnamed protein product, partial [Allacma fusca]